MDYQNLLSIDPAKRSGKPCIRDTRITVYDVLDYLASGMSAAEISHEFPELTVEDIRACLAFAADRERRFARRCLICAVALRSESPAPFRVHAWRFVSRIFAVLHVGGITGLVEAVKAAIVAESRP